jgi:tetratricopeptide (TPR) repeat protein
MHTDADLPQCPKCKAPSNPKARFCTACGASLQHPTCTKCGQFLQEGARFCTGCGTPARSTNNAANETALESAIAALDLAIHRADPRRALQAALDCIAKAPTTEQAVVASVIAMSAHAQLGEFEQAQSCLLKARGLYAAHLGLDERQQARFINEAVLIDDLREAGDRDVRENPWLYFIMGHAYGPHLPNAQTGETDTEKRRTAMDGWGEFFRGDRQRFVGALAFLCTSAGQYAEAAKFFESVVLIARKYESVSPVRIESLWPLVALGDCYWKTQEHAKAVVCWQRARSIEQCIGPDLDGDSWSLLALPWIDKAKSRLAERNERVPAPEVSREASKHLGLAITYLLEAEQFEARGVMLDELVDMIRQAGRRFTAPLERATSELENVARLDRYAWTRDPVNDTSYWHRYESAKGYLLQKTAFVHLTNEKLALAVATYKQAAEVWPSLSFCAMLAGLQATCGLRAEAIATYRMCIDRAEELGTMESSADEEELLAGVREGLSQLAS